MKVTEDKRKASYKISTPEYTYIKRTCEWYKYYGLDIEEVEAFRYSSSEPYNMKDTLVHFKVLPCQTFARVWEVKDGEILSEVKTTYRLFLLD